MMKYTVLLFALLSLACTGIIDGKNGGGSAQAAGRSGAGGTSPVTPANEGPAFKVRNSTPELVPFEFRLRRVASAVGVPVSHSMFTEMHENNIKLGDHDYANGALPDGSWNANRIAGWLQALRPVCNSPEFKARYTALPANLPQLVRAAWGRSLSAEDQTELTAALAESGVDAATAYESTCMAVFSAAEFVYR